MVALFTQLLLAIRSRFSRRARLEAENLLLRQQLIVLRRQHPKPDPQKVCYVQIWHIHFMNGVFPRTAIFNHRFGSERKTLPLSSGFIEISPLRERHVKV
jgi:hypothetical protein